MCSSIREFGFKIPVLARSDGEVVDGHLKDQGGAQAANDRSSSAALESLVADPSEGLSTDGESLVTWASWDDELLALELQELSPEGLVISRKIRQRYLVRRGGLEPPALT
jgi:hypothetical protein